MARKQFRHKRIGGNVRGKEKGGPKQLDAEWNEFSDDHTESNLAVCPSCHRAYCGWFECDSENDKERLWWHSIDAFLTEILQSRRLSLPRSVSVDTDSHPSEEMSENASVPRQTSHSIEVRLADYLENFGSFDQDIRPLLSDSIRDAHILTNWLAAAHPNCDPQNVTKLLCLFSPFWVRSPRNFNQAGSSSLFDHLFAVCEVPAFLRTEWLKGFQINKTRQDLKWLCWFVLLGQGASLKRSSRRFGWHIVGQFPQHLVQAPGGLSTMEACIYAEVRRLGGTEVEFLRLIRNPAFVVDPTEPFPEEQFWRETVRWMVVHREEMTDAEADLILAWAVHELTERQRGAGSFFWKGRSVSATLKLSREYRRVMERPWSRFQWAGNDLDWTFEAEHLGKWSFVELKSGNELFEEGTALHHCVAIYAQRCAWGDSAIVSLRRCGAPCITLEVDPRQRRVVQARGTCNRPTNMQEERVIQEWIKRILSADKLG